MVVTINKITSLSIVIILLALYTSKTPINQNRAGGTTMELAADRSSKRASCQAAPTVPLLGCCSGTSMKSPQLRTPTVWCIYIYMLYFKLHFLTATQAIVWRRLWGPKKQTKKHCHRSFCRMWHGVTLGYRRNLDN